MEKQTSLAPEKVENETEAKGSEVNIRIRIINYIVVIFFGLGLILSGGYALFTKHKTIQNEKALVELRAHKRAHSFDAIPRCIASCMLPPMLAKGCSHLDAQCLCRNLRSLDDYDDTPKPPPRRIRLVKRIPDEVFDDGSTTEPITEVTVTVLDVTDSSSTLEDDKKILEGVVGESYNNLGVDEVDDLDPDIVDVQGSRLHGENAETVAVELENGQKESEDADTVADIVGTETIASATNEDGSPELDVLSGDETTTGNVDNAAMNSEAGGNSASEETDEVIIDPATTNVQIDGNEKPDLVQTDNEAASNETIDDPPSAIQDPVSKAVDYEEVEYGATADVTVDKDREFKMCVEECSLHDQIRVPGLLAEYCWGNGAPFEFPEVMMPMVKRAGGYGTGSAYGYGYITGSFETSPEASASATGTSRTFATLPPVVSATNTGAISSGTATRSATGALSSGTATGVQNTDTVTTFPTFTVTPPTPEPSGGLSDGAKIGIGVAVPLVALIVVGAFGFWWFRIRKRKPQGQSASNYTEQYTGMPELAGGAVVRPMGGAGGAPQMYEIKKPEVVYGANNYQRPVEAGGIPISPHTVSEIDGTRLPERSAYDLQNTTSTGRSPLAANRKPVSGSSQTTASGFPAPWESHEHQYLPTPMMSNMGNSSVTSLHNREVSASSHHVSSATTAVQPSNPSHASPSEVRPQDSISQVGSATGANNALGVSDDQEIANMEREMAEIKERKERLRQVAELEQREEALKREIEARKKRIGGGSGSGAGS
ncbi:hypothetical protein GLAREA_05477 [Glarea lozoyensis ATCC 20868]|uniref:Extracellular membrane protein CFEM domain-containing protein n=1 Tax=Glarea lozoyensis (strain ATCC 20868 / MF5171) TaxID=1116229 RepID=S3DG79_GLAL2|nr:uncharacterized protein GLAREA_05477 [Glarea lozoyensis ATCC 20868]EPE36139.1 hypothetical protein GLAREA_05477 [Glarea lozoyensis ATCC 20868]